MRTVEEIVAISEEKAQKQFREVEDIAFFNECKVIEAFKKNRVALRHFSGSTGYGGGDDGRDVLNQVFADAFCAESAYATPHILSGTHALTVALFGILRPNDLLLSITGKPYDTLDEVIRGGDGSLADFGIKYDCVEMLGDEIDLSGVEAKLKTCTPKVVFIQRSRGYSSRNALSIDKIAKAISVVRSILPNVCIMVDNCYGEFIEKREPTEVGADIIVGSMIKNPGGGIAPTGGYVAGKSKYVDMIAGRVTSPSLGTDIGSYQSGYQYFFQGLFLSPHTVSQAVKGSILFAYALTEAGFKTIPEPQAKCGDIIRDVVFENENDLIEFIRQIQLCSPVDSFAYCEPSEMPGYEDKVIMAAGCFVQGASLELSVDSPIKAPYIAYLQGGLTYEHCKYAVINCLRALLKQ